MPLMQSSGVLYTSTSGLLGVFHVFAVHVHVANLWDAEDEGVVHQ